LPGDVIKTLMSHDGWYRVLIVARDDGLFQYSYEELRNISEDGAFADEFYCTDEFFWDWRGALSGLYESSEEAERQARRSIYLTTETDDAQRPQRRKTPR
jgi:hypothetical protein